MRKPKVDHEEIAHAPRCNTRPKSFPNNFFNPSGMRYKENALVFSHVSLENQQEISLIVTRSTPLSQGHELHAQEWFLVSPLENILHNATKQ